MATLTSDQLADLRSDAGIENSQTVTITGNPTGGTFTLTYKAQTSAAITWDADESEVESALQALSTIGAGNATVTGAEAGPWAVYISRDDGTVMTATSNLTGGTSPAIRVSLKVYLSNDALNRAYTRATADYPDDAYAAAVVYVLRQRLAEAYRLAVYTVGVDGLNRQKVFENIQAMLKMWEGIAGLDGGSLSAGTLSLGLDTTEEDLNAEWSS